MSFREADTITYTAIELGIIKESVDFLKKNIFNLLSIFWKK
jgi:hypothetical protein